MRVYVNNSCLTLQTLEADTRVALARRRDAAARLTAARRWLRTTRAALGELGEVAAARNANAAATSSGAAGATAATEPTANASDTLAFGEGPTKYAEPVTFTSRMESQEIEFLDGGDGDASDNEYTTAAATAVAAVLPPSTSITPATAADAAASSSASREAVATAAVRKIARVVAARAAETRAELRRRDGVAARLPPLRVQVAFLERVVAELVYSVRDSALRDHRTIRAYHHHNSSAHRATISNARSSFLVYQDAASWLSSPGSGTWSRSGKRRFGMDGGLAGLQRLREKRATGVLTTTVADRPVALPTRGDGASVAKSSGQSATPSSSTAFARAAAGRCRAWRESNPHSSRSSLGGRGRAMCSQVYALSTRRMNGRRGRPPRVAGAPSRRVSALV